MNRDYLLDGRIVPVPLNYWNDDESDSESDNQYYSDNSSSGDVLSSVFPTFFECLSGLNSPSVFNDPYGLDFSYNRHAHSKNFNASNAQLAYSTVPVEQSFNGLNNSHSVFPSGTMNYNPANQMIMPLMGMMMSMISQMINMMMQLINKTANNTMNGQDNGNLNNTPGVNQDIFRGNTPFPGQPFSDNTFNNTPNPNNRNDSLYNKHDSTLKQARLNLTSAQQTDLKRFRSSYTQNQHRYEEVSRKTGVPAQLIAALHWRESGGNFNTYLHQGDPLGKPAVHIPRNIPVFHKWEDAAVHALNMKQNTKNKYGLSSSSRDLPAMLAFSEVYNGLGYHNKSRVSPYVYSGTNAYDNGKYVADGVFNSNYKDKQLGVLAMLMSIC